jgi:hypothetical protein
MSKSRLLMATGAALALLAIAAGCGSDDEAGSTETTDTAVASQPLTAEQWDAYTEARTSFTDASENARSKLATCGGATTSAEQLQRCVGDAFSDLATETAAFAAVLEGFQGTVEGACADALDAFLNYARPYQATAEEMQTVIDEGNLAAYPGVSSNFDVVSAGGREEAEAFEESCQPA